jgi:hypothetical protein
MGALGPPTAIGVRFAGDTSLACAGSEIASVSFGVNEPIRSDTTTTPTPTPPMPIPSKSVPTNLIAGARLIRRDSADSGMGSWFRLHVQLPLISSSWANFAATSLVFPKHEGGNVTAPPLMLDVETLSRDAKASSPGATSQCSPPPGPAPQ